MAARSGILGLGSRLYPGNMQRIFNYKDHTRFMQSLSRERQNRASKKKALLAGWEYDSLNYTSVDHTTLGVNTTLETVIKPTPLQNDFGPRTCFLQLPQVTFEATLFTLQWLPVTSAPQQHFFHFQN